MAMGDSDGKYVSNLITWVIGLITMNIWYVVGGLFGLIGNWEFGHLAILDVGMTSREAFGEVSYNFESEMAYEL
jgi:hypothetical protein